jgi:hypothetical protein
MEKNGVVWPRGGEPVNIEIIGSNELAKSDAAAYYKQPELEIFGIILDADSDAEARWLKVTELFGAYVPKFPKEVVVEGFISEPTPEGIRFGAWIMPDNRSRGMLETFLHFLVRNEHVQLWQHACDATDKASSNHSAPYKSVHVDKARIHTYLAWQDEPGCQLHEAVNYAILDPLSPYCQPFVTWFKTLFDLNNKA